MEPTKKMKNDAAVYLRKSGLTHVDCVEAAYLAGRRAQAEDDAGLLKACKRLRTALIDGPTTNPQRSLEFSRKAIAKAEG